MAEREDNVYKAKLAEQAERYEGNGALGPLLVLWAWLVDMVRLGKKNACERFHPFFFLPFLSPFNILFSSRPSELDPQADFLHL